MANTLLTPSIIAQEALLALENNLVMASLVHRDYSKEFAKVGSTITIRKPPAYTAQEFTTTTSTQNITETSTTIVLNKHLDVTVDLEPTDLTLKLYDFNELITNPAMRAIGQSIDTNLTALYSGVPYYTGDAASTPDALSDIANCNKVLNTNKVPRGLRSMVIDPSAEAKIVILDGIVNIDKSGSPQALRDAVIGRILGFETAMDQNVAQHTAGTPGGSPTATGTADALSVTIASGGAAGTYLAGDLITIATLTGYQFVVTANCTLNGSGAGTLYLYPALPSSITTQVVTLVASHRANLAFHKNAFAMVNRPLAIPVGLESQGAYVDNPQTGLSIRVMYGYNMSTKKQTISFDGLFGFKCIYPELAVRLLG